MIGELALPEEVHLALVARKQVIVPARGRTLIREGDHVFVVHHRDSRALMDRLFGGASPERAPVTCFVEFVFVGGTTVGELRRCYGFDISAGSEMTLEEFLKTDDLDGELEVGEFTRRGDWTLKVRRMAENRVDLVGVSFTPNEAA